MQNEKYSRIKSLYKLSIETRNFEIQQLVQRNNFFMVFQGMLLAGLMQASGGSPIPIVSFLVCGCGFSVSVLQIGMAAGAKFWQERWETEAEEKVRKLLSVLSEEGIDVGDDFWKLFSLPRDASRAIVFKKQKGFTGWLINLKFSVSRIPIYSGVVFSVFWFFLLMSTIQSPFNLSVPKFISGFDGVDKNSLDRGGASKENKLDDVKPEVQHP